MDEYQANRKYELNLQFGIHPINISVLFNKFNTDLNFETCNNVKELNQNSVVNISIFKNLNTSSFARTFIKTVSINKNNLDIINQYHGIKNKYNYQKINFITSEEIILNKLRTTFGIYSDVVYINVLTLIGKERDFVYVIAERQFINTNINKKMVRTAALQICKPEFFETLLKYEKQYNDSRKKFLKDKFEEQQYDKHIIKDFTIL